MTRAPVGRRDLGDERRRTGGCRVVREVQTGGVGDLTGADELDADVGDRHAACCAGERSGAPLRCQVVHTGHRRHGFHGATNVVGSASPVPCCPAGDSPRGSAMYTLREPVDRAEQLFTAREAVVVRWHPPHVPGAGRTGATDRGLAARAPPGDRVALWALNSDRYLELFIGIPCADRAIVPHNTRWAEPELVDGTVDAGARVLICDREPGGLADVVDHVVRLDTGEYDELLPRPRSWTSAYGARTMWRGSSTPAGRPARRRASCSLTQPDRQRVPHARPAARGDVLPGDGADVPRRRVERRPRPAVWNGATHGPSRRSTRAPSLDSIERNGITCVSPCRRCWRPSSSSRRRPRATSRSLRWLVARRVARRPRGASAARPRRFRLRADRALRGHRALAAGHRVPPRGAVCSTAAGRRSAGSRCTGGDGAHRRRRRRGAAAPARRARSWSAART